MHNINNNNTQYASQYIGGGSAGSLTRSVPGQPAASRSDRRTVQMDCFAVQVVPAGRGSPPPRRPLPGLRPHPGLCRRPHRRGQVRQLSDSQPQAQADSDSVS